MPDETSVAEPSVEEQMEGRQSKGSKKKKSKGAKKAAPKAKDKKPAVKKVGVIAVIAEKISSEKGASTAEIVEALKKKFPERSADGMTTTVRIQVTRLPKRFGFDLKKTKDEKRGLVYKAPASLPGKLAKAE